MDTNSNQIEAVDNAAYPQLGDGNTPTNNINNEDPAATECVDHLNNKPLKPTSANAGRGDSPSVSNRDHNDSPGGGVVRDEARASFDPQKSKERDERLRQARERREELERRRLDELREAMTRHQEARKRQEEERRRKIGEMKKREEEHRSIVEERRKRLQDEENERRQAILRRTAERDARLELMKPVKKSPVATAFGGCTSSAAAVHARVTGSSQNIVSPGIATRRSAGSSRDIYRLGDPVTTGTATAGSTSAAAALKRLSMSTGHLGMKKSLSDKTPTATMGNVAKDAAEAEEDKEKESEDGSVSPSVKVRARSTGPPGVRRSRVDTHKPAAPVDRITPRDSASAAQNKERAAGTSGAPSQSDSTQRLARVKSMPSKLNVDQKKSHGGPATAAAATPPAPSNLTTSSRSRTASAKRMTRSAVSSSATTPTASGGAAVSGGAATPTSSKSMPNPPKSMAPRSIPKEPKAMKEVTANKPTNTAKGVVKVVHKGVSQPLNAATNTAGLDTPRPVSGDNKLPGGSQPPVVEAEAKLPADTTALVAPPASVTVPASVPTAAPEAAEKTNAAKKTTTEADDYKAKLAENRRLAREKAEREAAEERERDEQRKHEEEERRRREEEEQLRREEEEMRLAEEARRLEEERFQRAVEEENRRRREEEERLEAERREREEAERLAREEAERKEKERLEKLKREEEERLERKKKLEMIMKRVKTDEGSLQKSDNGPSPVGSMSEGINKVASTDDPTSARSLVAPSVVASADSAGANSQFRSPLLRQMMSGKLVAASRGVAAASNGDEVGGSVAVAGATSEARGSSPVESSASELSVDSSNEQKSTVSAQQIPTGTVVDVSKSSSAYTVDSLEGSTEVNFDTSSSSAINGSPSAETSPRLSSASEQRSVQHEDILAVFDAPLNPSPRIGLESLVSLESSALPPDSSPLVDFSYVNGAEASSECDSAAAIAATNPALSNGLEPVDILSQGAKPKPFHDCAAGDAASADEAASGDQPTCDETIDLSTAVSLSAPSESTETSNSRVPPATPLIAFE